MDGSPPHMASYEYKRTERRVARATRYHKGSSARKELNKPRVCAADSQPPRSRREPRSCHGGFCD
ncbi:hypothetical protein KIN20_000144 [Parelaphostrongylus tenuis]|uniref:Uncharacterized protein n=1 Tax=Parelaphostrongylus tenuis TaxID=148309 RepID=A0AAD5QFD9_PARTN|nr:hypothetical protein KIN20_000144 [Parelaphostrongylus tenuis]